MSLGIEVNFIACVQINYKSYINEINSCLDYLSRTNNLKISERINRNDFVIALDEGIDFLIHEQELKKYLLLYGTTINNILFFIEFPQKN